MNLFDLGYEPTDLHVTISDLMVATADDSDAALDSTISEVLKTLRDRMGMDVVFCSEFVDGCRVFRQVETTGVRPTIAVGGSDLLEESWCQRVVDGRLPRFIADAREDPTAAGLLDQLPFSIGTHISTPIVLKSGEIYGTLCCLRISVATGHSVRFLLDSGNGRTWTPGSALLDTRNLMQLGVDFAAPSCHVGWPGGCKAG